MRGFFWDVEAGKAISNGMNVNMNAISAGCEQIGFSSYREIFWRTFWARRAQSERKPYKTNEKTP